MQNLDAIDISVSEAVDIINQALNYAFPSMAIVGELANVRISKNKWLYFDIKDEASIIRCFGTVYQLPGPLEDGMKVRIVGIPRIHNQYGFSITVQHITPVGQGAIKKAQNLLEYKLRKEGLFEDSRKRSLPYPPEVVYVVTSEKSAAYHDFLKIVGERWPLAELRVADVHVQGSQAVADCISAIEYCNELSTNPIENNEVLVLIRGGGSAEDLQAFNDERLVRAVAASRLPTVSAIGHESDNSFVEMVSDLRASTPSNAAELITPDKRDWLASVRKDTLRLHKSCQSALERRTDMIYQNKKSVNYFVNSLLDKNQSKVQQTKQLLNSLNPNTILRRGYALARTSKGYIRSVNDAKIADRFGVVFYDGQILVRVDEGKSIKKGKNK